jgi:hypothetical protein
MSEPKKEFTYELRISVKVKTDESLVPSHWKDDLQNPNGGLAKALRESGLQTLAPHPYGRKADEQKVVLGPIQVEII